MMNALLKTPILQGVYLEKAGCLNLLIDRHVLFSSKEPKTIETRQQQGFVELNFRLHKEAKSRFCSCLGRPLRSWISEFH